MIRDKCREISCDKSRIRLVLGILSVLYFLAIIKMAYLQVVKHGEYVKIASVQHWAQDVIQAKRGKIYVKDEFVGGLYPLADNMSLDYIFAAPEEIKDKGEVAKRIAPIIDETKEKIEDLLVRNRTFVIIKKKLTAEQSEKIRNENISGIYLRAESIRYYPEETLASQVLGYVDGEGEGKYGIEQFENDILSGVPGLYRAEIDPSGKRIAYGEKIQVAPKDGADITLTINRDVQVEAERVIKNSVGKHSAENGSIIVMKPSTGEILAMANYPTYNPNAFGDVKDYKDFRNSAITDEYEPGSIFKTVTMAAGLDTGKINPETEFEDLGRIRLGGHEIRNSDKKAHGWVDMTYALRESLNTGMVYILDKIGKKTFFEYINKFGFGKRTGIEQIGEATGRIYSPETVGINDHTYATMSFGQSLTVTPIQMVSAYAAIANNGNLLRPFLISEKKYSDGNVEKTELKIISKTMSSEAAAKERKMMVEVVERGHGYAAKVPGYKVAGKTGTAQVPRKDGRGYDPNKNIGSFVGIAPASSPEFVVLAKIDSPKGVVWAEASAAPVVGQMFDFLFKYYQIPPTEASR